MSDIVLREYESVECELAPEDPLIIRELFGSKLAVIPARGPGRYRLTASSYVGAATLGGGRRLIVEPKVPVPTLFGVIAEVYEGVESLFSTSPFDYDTVEGLFEFVVHLFTTRAEDLVARGLVRGYRTVIDEPPAVRGRLLVGESLARHPGLHHRHVCSHGEFTLDRPENRILAWTVHLLAMYDYRRPTLLHALRRLAATMSEIPLDADALLLFERFTYDRLNEHYRPVLALARLLLDHLAYGGRAGRQTFLAFSLDMNALFERYLTCILTRALGREDIGVRGQVPLKLDHGNTVDLYPDIVLYRNDRPLLVVDAKYKLKKHREDIYQMVAYCHALGLPQAVLVHPASEGAPAGTLDIRGIGGLRVHYRTLDLAGDPMQLRRSAVDLAASLLELVTAPVVA